VHGANPRHKKSNYQNSFYYVYKLEYVCWYTILSIQAAKITMGHMVVYAKPQNCCYSWFLLSPLLLFCRSECVFTSYHSTFKAKKYGTFNNKKLLWFYSILTFVHTT